jgi:hypothetical protein
MLQDRPPVRPWGLPPLVQSVLASSGAAGGLVRLVAMLGWAHSRAGTPGPSPPSVEPPWSRRTTTDRVPSGGSFKQLFSLAAGVLPSMSHLPAQAQGSPRERWPCARPSGARAAGLWWGELEQRSRRTTPVLGAKMTLGRCASGIGEAPGRHRPPKSRRGASVRGLPTPPARPRAWEP